MSVIYVNMREKSMSMQSIRAQFNVFTDLLLTYRVKQNEWSIDACKKTKQKHTHTQKGKRYKTVQCYNYIIGIACNRDHMHSGFPLKKPESVRI